MWSTLQLFKPTSTSATYSKSMQKLGNELFVLLAPGKITAEKHAIRKARNSTTQKRQAFGSHGPSKLSLASFNALSIHLSNNSLQGIEFVSFSQNLFGIVVSSRQTASISHTGSNLSLSRAALDNSMDKTSQQYPKPPPWATRDLVMPPFMSSLKSPPPLSPRIGNLSCLEWDTSDIVSTQSLFSQASGALWKLFLELCNLCGLLLTFAVFVHLPLLHL